MTDPAVKGAFSNLKQLSRELFQIIRLSSLVSQDSSRMPPMLARQLEVFVARKDISEAGSLADFMAILGQSSYEDRLSMLAAVPIITRLQRAGDLLTKQIASLQGSTKIITITNTDSPRGIPDGDQLKELERQNSKRLENARRMSGFLTKPPGGLLGGGSNDEEEGSEITDLQKRLDSANMSAEAQKVAAREIKRLLKMNPAMAEYNVIRNYLETLSEIPWSKSTDDKLDGAMLARARKQLDDDHYGLEKIKKRLLEYLAVLRLKQQANAELDSQIQIMGEKEQDQHPKSIASADGTAVETPEQAEKPVEESTEMQALKRRRMTDKSPILLLAGPPGTGKTSLAKSIATALGRKFHRISLGGVRDEAEIRGHRRTYVAAMPGLIISALRKVGVNNPVILLDEIDKISQSNHHGDPSAAMLEVLDPEQNYTFNDHYVSVPVDLSKVLFIATANNLDTIPAPLLDRMEMIHLSGYTTLEKRHIATRHLVPKQISTNGLHEGEVQLPSDVVDKIITSYTRESGVRNLEREIGSVCRYKAVQYSEARSSSNPDDSTLTNTSDSTQPYNPAVTIADLDEILGIERYEDELAMSSLPRPGVVTGLVAYSGLGQGSILFIEIAEMPGKGRVQLTGKLGDVLKESVEVALSWVKSHAFTLGIAADEHEDVMARRSIHIHVPSGAVPKDGPSAGLAHTIALVSLFSGRVVPASLAMTGEVSLRGKVMPVGGIKEKLIGALTAGVKVVMLPVANRKDVRDLPEEVKQGLRIVFVANVWEALRVVWPEEKWGEWEVESRL